MIVFSSSSACLRVVSALSSSAFPYFVARPFQLSRLTLGPLPLPPLCPIVSRVHIPFSFSSPFPSASSLTHWNSVAFVAPPPIPRSLGTSLTVAAWIPHPTVAPARCCRCKFLAVARKVLREPQVGCRRQQGSWPGVASTSSVEAAARRSSQRSLARTSVPVAVADGDAQAVEHTSSPAAV